MKVYNVLAILASAAFLLVGCGSANDLSNGENDLTGKSRTASKTTSADPTKACYYGCIKKGIDAGKCKAICTQKKDTASAKDWYYTCIKKGYDAADCKKKAAYANKQKSSTSKGNSCYYECIKKGIDAKKCKYHYCAKKEEHSNKSCYYGCIKKGVDASKCKYHCASKSKKIQPGCKEHSGCKLCWDHTGKIVKKYCPQSQGHSSKACYYGCVKKGYDEGLCKKKCFATPSKKVQPGCKVDSKSKCKLCWDYTGKIVKKYCPDDKPVACKVDPNSGCKICWYVTGGKKYAKKYCPQKKVQPGCKVDPKSKCKLCWDYTGKIVKKYCPQSQGSSSKECYYGCVKKGYDEGLCKKKCFAAPSKKVQPGCKLDPKSKCKLCWDYTGKIVKKYCPKASSPSKSGCKVSGNCKICWDTAGNVKKYCK